jgi:hypothetical protein
MDSDDISVPNRFEEQMNFLFTTKVDLVGSWAYIIDMNGKVIGYIRPPTNPRRIRERILLHNPILHSSILFQRKILKDVGLYNPVYSGAEDYEFYLRCIARGCSLANIPSFLHYIRENPQSLTRGSLWRQARANYLRAKIDAVTRYGYTRLSDIIFCLGSLPALAITPKHALLLKELLGWYYPAGITI